MSLDHVAALREEVEMLREENSQLRALAFGGNDDISAARCRKVFKVSPSSASIILSLMRRGYCSQEYIYQLLYNDKIDQPSGETIRVFVMRARRAAARHGIQIENVWGQGYRMPPESQEIAKRLLETGTNDAG